MANNQGLAEHHAVVTVNAPVHQVYGLFTHFNDFPKFMSFVKEVTYYDNQRSHWVAEVVGKHEWDAVNDNWMEDRQIGWYSTNGLENNGKVTFQSLGNNQTQVDVYVNYNPPAGLLGDIGENLGAGSNFNSKLQHDMDNFAQMVDQAPPGALDPNSSNYLFHADSAAAKGTTTDRQNSTMGDATPNTANYGTNTNANYAPGSNVNATNPTNYGASGVNAAPEGTQYPGTTNTGVRGDYATSGATPETRPTLDSDIIGGNTGNTGTNYPQNQGNYPQNQGMNTPDQGMMQQNTGTTTTYTPNQGTMPQNTGTNYPQGQGVIPPGTGTANPVMPPNTGTNYPQDQGVNPNDQGVMPPDSGTRNPVMPPETGASNPVMPPENDNNF